MNWSHARNGVGRPGAAWLTALALAAAAASSSPAQAASAELDIVGNAGSCNGGQYAGSSPTAFSLSATCGSFGSSTTSAAYLQAVVVGTAADGGGSQGKVLMSDTLFVSGASGVGYLQYSVSVSGFFTLDPCGNCEGSTTLTVSDLGQATFSTSIHLVAPGTRTYSTTLPVTQQFFFGQAKTIHYSFDVFQVAQAASSVVHEQFTLSQVTPFVVLDAQHQPVAGASIVAASGTDYLAPAVPEPSVAGLLLLGLPVLLAHRRRRAEARR